MRLHGKSIDKDGHGYVVLTPEEPEDIWHAYNLITVGDRLRASTIRNVKQESSTGSVESSRQRVTLTIVIESIEPDIPASTLRIHGRNDEENSFVRMGAYHTIDLDLHHKFTLSKLEWDSVSLERLEVACDAKHVADVAAVLMQEGFACVCLVTPSMTVVKAKIEVNIPRKRKGHAAQHDKALDKFFDAILQAVIRHIDFSIVKCLIVGSPGFVKDQFMAFVRAEVLKHPEMKSFAENLPKFLLVHASSGYKHSLREILADPAISARLADTKAAGEVKALDAFFDMLNQDPDRAFYGFNHVKRANDEKAVDTMMISDALFRSQDIKDRKKYVKLVDEVRENGGTVHIFSSMHVSGQQLTDLSGIAAILRFPMPEIDEENQDAAAAVAADNVPE